eukprot:TRINITY_DN17726_c0_g1_i1.p1 TRINITY_DN17726_c0_g1~~TRINITY_DN17726_c0_g1_i1.p1  ORF type:complete len:629 (-),score=218.93 TRINITY_DN17726_c0_g1_i1:130-2016(-)
MTSFFKKKNKKELTFNFSAPQSFAHEGHLSFNAQNKGFEARNLPPELQVAFQELNELLKVYGLKGISKKEAQYLLKVVGEKVGKSVPDSAGSKGSKSNSPSLPKQNEKAPKLSRSGSKSVTPKSPSSPSSRRGTIDAAVSPVADVKTTPRDRSASIAETDNQSVLVEDSPSSARKSEPTKKRSSNKRDEELNKKLLELAEEHRQNVEVLNEQIKNLEEEQAKTFAEAETKLDSEQESNAALETKLLNFETELAGHQARTESAVANLTQIKAKVATSHITLQEKDDQIRRLKEMITVMEEDLAKDLSQAESVKQLTEETKASSGELEEISAKLGREVEKLNEEVNSRLADASSQSSALEIELKTNREEMMVHLSLLEERLKEEVKTKAQFQAESGSIKNEIALKDKFERNFQEEKRQMTAALARAEDEEKHAVERARTEDEALAKLLGNLESLSTSEKTALEAQKEIDVSNDQLRDQLGSVFEKIENVEKQLEQLRKRTVRTVTPESGTSGPSAPSSSGAPPPPPAPKNAPPPPPPSKGPPKGPPPPPSKTSSPSSSSPSSGPAPAASGVEGLLSAISRGTTLKKVERKEESTKVADQSLLGSLAQALLDRRANMGEEEEDDDDELLWD